MRARLVENPVVVVAILHEDLRMGDADAGRDRLRLPEIERRAVDGRDVAGRDARGIDGGVAFGD